MLVYRFVFALFSNGHGDAVYFTIPMVAFQNTWESMTCQTIIEDIVCNVYMAVGVSSTKRPEVEDGE